MVSLFGRGFDSLQVHKGSTRTSFFFACCSRFAFMASGLGRCCLCGLLPVVGCTGMVLTCILGAVAGVLPPYLLWFD